MSRLLILILVVLVLLGSPAGAKLIDIPEAVSYLHAEVLKQGSLTLSPDGPNPEVTSLEVRHTVPQGTDRQETRLLSVEGPDSHEFGEDDFGNEIIILKWDDPPIGRKLSYFVSFDVRVWDRDDSAPERGFQTTGMTEPSQGITEAAYEVAAGLTSMQKFMQLTSYVYELVEYDRTFQNVQKSASWVFDNRKAVCDGHANLLISVLRALGFDAYYVIGYAYTEDNPDPAQGYWGPHGWVEVEYQGRAISLDPTWLEHPVDATHIKFAVAPDSNYTEFMQVMSRDVDVDWEKGEYVVTMLEHETEPRVGIQSRLVPETAGPEKNAVMVTEVSSLEEGCVLTRLRAVSCESGGEPFLVIEPSSRSIALCKDQSLMWLISTPDIMRGMEYTCGVIVQGPEADSNQTLRISESSEHIELSMSSPRVLTEGQLFRVNTTAQNTGLSSEGLELMLMLGEQFQEHEATVPGMQALDLAWTGRAPREAGRYLLRFFASSGDMLEEDIEVIEERRVRLSGVSIPHNITLGEPASINITLEGLANASGEAIVKIGDAELERPFSLERGRRETMEFTYEPASEGTKRVSLVVLFVDGSYEDGLVTSLEVVRHREWWEPIVETIRGLLESLFSALGMS